MLKPDSEFVWLEVLQAGSHGAAARGCLGTRGEAVVDWVHHLYAREKLCPYFVRSESAGIVGCMLKALECSYLRIFAAVTTIYQAYHP